MLVSTHGLGLDGLLWHYPAFPKSQATQALESHLYQESQGLYTFPVAPYLAEGNSAWVATTGQGMLQGITATLSGFYAPQGRSLRAGLGRPGLISFLQQWRGPTGERVTNFEMETAAIFGLAALMGHQASACNAILANRPLGTFHPQPDQAVDGLIRQVLENISATI
jgi:uridine phosphorylase